MSTIRHFTGTRESNKDSFAREIMQIEMQKKGKMPAEMRYKMLFKRKQEEAKEKAAKSMTGEMVNGQLVGQRKMSPRAEQALKEMAMKKAAKEQKKLRRMVIVQPQNFYNGRIDKKGQIFDIAGNMIGKVNTKNGKMVANSGWSIGKYKPKSYMTKLQIEQAINKHSPYYIKERLMQMQQAALAGGVHGGYVDPNVVNVHGVQANAAMLGGGMYGNVGQHDYGVHGPSQDHGMPGVQGATGALTVLGSMSNNPWGVHSGNVHGTVGDNVFGTVSSDVWGGVAGSDLWGKRGVRMYGTGSGKNYLGGITKFILSVFGIKTKAAREAQKAIRTARMAGGAAPRAAAPRRR